MILFITLDTYLTLFWRIYILGKNYKCILHERTHYKQSLVVHVVAGRVSDTIYHAL